MASWEDILIDEPSVTGWLLRDGEGLSSWKDGERHCLEKEDMPRRRH